MNKHIQLFNKIAPIYRLFYNRQLKKYQEFVMFLDHKLTTVELKTGLDVGCGTGALIRAFDEHGMQMTGLDGAEKMIAFASKKQINRDIKFMHHDVLNGLPFKENSFDFVIASYVVHGLTREQRIQLLESMKHVSKNVVILYEHAKKTSKFVELLETLEGGQYFSFREHIDDDIQSIFPYYERIMYKKNIDVYVCFIHHK